MSTDGPERAERKLAAILAADVVGYSRLMGEDEEGTLAALKAVRREVTDPKFKEHRGRIVKTTGDGLLVEFASVVDAVRCAVEVQRAISSRNADSPAREQITFRIGINVGDVIIDEHDIFGDGVNVAARLEGLAEPGGIYVSRVVRDQVRDKLSFGFEDMGERQVKNIARPVHVFRVTLGGQRRKEGSAEGPSPPQNRFPMRPAAIAAAVAALIGAAVLTRALPPRSEEVGAPAAAGPSSPSIGDPVIFDKGEALLPGSSGPTIDRQAEFLRAHPTIRVTVKAFCAEDEGLREGPRNLAQLRANQLRDALKARGVAGDRIRTENACPYEKAATATGRAAVPQRPRAVVERDP